MRHTEIEERDAEASKYSWFSEEVSRKECPRRQTFASFPEREGSKTDRTNQQHRYEVRIVPTAVRSQGKRYEKQ